jgi:hypothetical protein
MKEMKRTSYISAYPLKTLEQAQAAAAEPSNRNEGSAYLKGLLADRAKSVSRIRISPMSNPYKAPVIETVSRTAVPSEDINSGKKDWFNHYE